MTGTVECYCGAVVIAHAESSPNGLFVDARCPDCGRWCGFTIAPKEEREQEVEFLVSVVEEDSHHAPLRRSFKTREEAEEFASIHNRPPFVTVRIERRVWE